MWILVWIQGWISTYANVQVRDSLLAVEWGLISRSFQAVFVISTATSSRHLPRLINTLYLVVPLVVFAGLLVRRLPHSSAFDSCIPSQTPGVMCSNSWDFAFRCFERQIALLTPAEVQYDLTGALDAGVFDEVASLAAASATRLSRFYVEYLAMLIVWSMASVILVVVRRITTSHAPNLTFHHRLTLPESSSSSASDSKSSATPSFTPSELHPSLRNSTSPRARLRPSPRCVLSRTFAWTTTRPPTSACRSSPFRTPPRSPTLSLESTISQKPRATRTKGRWRSSCET